MMIYIDDFENELIPIDGIAPFPVNENVNEIKNEIENGNKLFTPDENGNIELFKVQFKKLNKIKIITKNISSRNINKIDYMICIE